ncbi:uncharacterized protein C05D11.13-like isoform X1 [Uranotaenia lowii]|uniref:uncharacterized protein C05D11.13-like isoform X1 n=1 Tax=Uranotaenia lowii TaxID=190385 RepID=UPI00247AC06E|nr:uncharacterized protein C05D11.13-like isoform X1 [Uranotaenia lowii]
MNPGAFPPHQIQPSVYNILPSQLPQLTQLPQLPQISQPQQIPPAAAPTDKNNTNLTKAQRRMLGESEAARARRLSKNAERMRQKRSNETYEEYKVRLAKNAESNRRRRANESDAERALRHMRNAMRQRLRRAMETPEQKSLRRARLAQRMREKRATETPEQRKDRLEKGAARARQRFLNETAEQRAERNKKKAEYARLFRINKQQNNQSQQISDAGCSKVPPQQATNPQNSNDMNIKVEQQQQHSSANNNANNINQMQHNTPIPLQTNETVPPANRDQGYPPAKNCPINYSDFGAAFPTFFNYPHLKNGQQNSAYSPAYPSQNYYPELSVPSHYMKNDRATFPTPKSGECVQSLNPPKGTPQKN